MLCCGVGSFLHSPSDLSSKNGFLFLCLLLGSKSELRSDVCSAFAHFALAFSKLSETNIYQINNLLINKLKENMHSNTTQENYFRVNILYTYDICVHPLIDVFDI